MSCVADIPTFRLLDHLVGWDDMDHSGLVGLGEAEGLRLEPLAGRGATAAPDEVAPLLPPARLARRDGASRDGARRDCCGWVLVTPSPPAPRLLGLGPCDCAWRPLWLGGRAPEGMGDAVAVATWRQLIAVSDAEARRVWTWAGDGRQLVADFPVESPGPLAFTPQGQLLVITENGRRLRAFDPSGHPLNFPPPRPLGGEGWAEGETPDRLAVSADGTIWVVTRVERLLKPWRARPNEVAFTPATPDQLATAFEPSDLERVSADGFLLARGCSSSWYGRTVAEVPAAPTTTRWAERGQLLTAAVDSGIPRCRWHRVRLDADVPPGASLAVAVATDESADPPTQGTAQAPWNAFPAGLPHPSDWQEATAARDFLVDQPPGRFLFLRLRLTGNGFTTPTVRRVRLDFPRATSLDQLPAVYRRDPRAEDFSERFLSLFDATLEDLDRAIERYPALLDPEGVPEEVLPWLGRFVALHFDPAWDTERRRSIFAALPELYRRRGTPDGLRLAIRLVFDVEPLIEELGAARGDWQALGEATIGAVRLFSRRRARLRLGASPLGGAPLKSFGNPDHDPLAVGAYRLRVVVPAGGVDTEALVRLVENQKPAHVVASVEVGAGSLVIGTSTRVGIDTVLAAPPPPVVGGLRLGRRSILRPGPRRLGAVGLHVGHTSSVAGIVCHPPCNPPCRIGPLDHPAGSEVIP